MFVKNGPLRKFGPVLLAFVLAAAGVLVLAGAKSASGDAQGEVTRPTLVAVSSIDAGTPTSALSGLVEVRMLPETARATGAVASLAEVPSGVLGSRLVAGQQLLTSSVVEEQRKGLGTDRIAVSAKLDPAQFAGPVATTGKRVNVYAVGANNAELIATDVVVLDAPDPGSLTPQQEVIVTLGVSPQQVSRVVGAVAGAGIWLVSA